MRLCELRLQAARWLVCQRHACASKFQHGPLSDPIFEMFQPLFCGFMFVSMFGSLFSCLSARLASMDKRRQCRGHVALILENLMNPWEIIFCSCDLFRCIPRHTIVCHSMDVKWVRNVSLSFADGCKATGPPRHTFLDFSRFL